MNLTTRRHPRTLQEAFGPYTDHDVYDADPPPYALTPAERALLVVIWTVSAGLVVALAAHVWARFA